MQDRDYILNRIKGRQITIEEFDYDNLMAPPLYSLLSPYDIEELRGIATSLRLSAKPQERYKLIDNVMRRKGFIKFAAGTNRVVYRHPEDTRYVIKIAADAIGMGDNPAEYRNQFILKPFCTKCFEISPCGTVGIFERVNPVTSREEYLSIADDVFELINTWIIGEYIMADIGEKFFMNTGIREGFGVVIIDYPYLYRLDGNKLYCRAPDNFSPSGRCDGIIDYDDGYNFLICKKCGTKYKAKELELKLKNNEIETRKEGEIKMKISVKGGSKSLQETKIVTNDTNENINKAVKAIPTSSMNITKTHVPVEEKKAEVNNIVPAVKKEEKKEDLQSSKVSVNGASLYKHAESPIEFNDKKAEEVASTVKPKKSPVFEIEEACKKIAANMEDIEFASVKEKAMDDLLDFVTGLFDKKDMYKRCIKFVKSTIESSEDEEFEEFIKDKNLVSIVENNFNAYVVAGEIETDDESLEDNEGRFNFEYGITFRHEAEDSNLESFTPIGNCESSMLLELPVCKCNHCDEDVEYTDPDTEEANEVAEDSSESVEENVETDEEGRIIYKGIEFYDAIITNIKDILPDEAPKDILVILDGDGGYISTGDGMIAGINTIDNQNVNAITTVSKKWLAAMTEELDELRSAAGTEKEISDISDEDVDSAIAEALESDDDVDTNVKAAPVGVFGANQNIDDAAKSFMEEEFGDDEESEE